MKINNFHLNFLPFSKFKYTKKQQLDIFMVRVSKMDWMRHKWIFIEKIETWKSFLKSPLKITVRSFKWRKFSNRKYRFYTYGNLKLFYSSNGYSNSRISLFHKVYGPFNGIERLYLFLYFITLRNCSSNKFDQSTCFSH